jgi:hypothetical protein
MDQRVSELDAGFRRFVDVFGRSERFSGPSWYFHRQTLEQRSKHESIESLLGDDGFFDSLYATLTAWGLHRMGPGNTKLRNLDDIRSSIVEQAKHIEALKTVKITEIGGSDASGIGDRVWLILTGLRVSIAKAQIVANSKTLHHLLPDLVPPMDREYTFRFFYGRNMLSVDERTAFGEMFTRLIGVAGSQRAVIAAVLDKSWNTSESKVVDNAIVGYLIAREAAEPREDIDDQAVSDVGS